MKRVHAIMLAIILLVTAVFAHPVAATEYFVAKTGNDANPGTENEPWLTIQKAADVMVAGDTVYVMEGVYVKEGACDANWSFCAIRPRKSGTSGNAITYASYPGHNVILDFQQDPDYHFGFYLESRSHIVIKGFEIINLRLVEAGRPDGPAAVFVNYNSDHITIENNNMHNITGQSGQNSGAIKLNGCDQCVVRNNSMHDVIAGAGINSYDMSNTIIENNEIWNATKGIFQKRSNGTKGAIIRHNLIRQIQEYGILYSIGGAGDEPHIDQEVYENIFIDMANGIYAGARETRLPSNGLYVWNNVFDTLQGIALNNYQNVRIWNNVFLHEDTSKYWYGAVTTVKSMPASWITLCDYNVHYPNSKFILNQYDSSEQTFYSLRDWQEATGLDAHSLDSDPLFLDKIEYRLNSDSPARNAGREGGIDSGKPLDIGAYPTGAGIVGTTRLLPPSSISVAPVN